jgi:trans-AT polyketide synthase/acyltransferase/oxidoreductase domain-containing protein
MNVLLFPGQGAQYKGMGKNVWANYPQLADAASQILGFSIIELCLNDPKDQLRLTQHTQPALYVANALHRFPPVIRWVWTLNELI